MLRGLLPNLSDQHQMSFLRMLMRTKQGASVCLWDLMVGGSQEHSQLLGLTTSLQPQSPAGDSPLAGKVGDKEMEEQAGGGLLSLAPQETLPPACERLKPQGSGEERPTQEKVWGRREKGRQKPLRSMLSLSGAKYSLHRLTLYHVRRECGVVLSALLLPLRNPPS